MKHVDYNDIKPKPLTLIPKGRSYLAVSVDSDSGNFDNPKKWIAVLLVGEGVEHEHIALTQHRAEMLRDWLDEFLAEIDKRG